jgi:hypothetical protein
LQRPNLELFENSWQLPGECVGCAPNFGDRNEDIRNDLTEAQWALVNSIIPEGKPEGRPQSIDVRAVVNAIFYSRTAGLAYPRDNADDIRILFHFGGRSRRQFAPEVECHHLIGWSPDALSRVVLRPDRPFSSTSYAYTLTRPRATPQQAITSVRSPMMHDAVKGPRIGKAARLSNHGPAPIVLPIPDLNLATR